jgi:hypothetical protein
MGSRLTMDLMPGSTFTEIFGCTLQNAACSSHGASAHAIRRHLKDVDSKLPNLSTSTCDRKVEQYTRQGYRQN